MGDSLLNLQRCNFITAEGRSLEIKESGYITEMNITALESCSLDIFIESLKPLPEQVMDRLRGVNDPARLMYRWYRMEKDETIKFSTFKCPTSITTPVKIRFSAPVRVVAEFIPEERRVKV